MASTAATAAATAAVQHIARTAIRSATMPAHRQQESGGQSGPSHPVIPLVNAAVTVLRPPPPAAAAAGPSATRPTPAYTWYPGMEQPSPAQPSPLPPNKIRRKTRKETRQERYDRLRPEDRAAFKQFRSRAKWLDGKHTCCCCLTVGIDPLIGLLPIVGDFAGVFLAVSLLLFALHRWQLPQHLVMRMALNTALDAMIGFVPIIGDIADFMFKCNLRNADLLEEHLRSLAMQHPALPPLQPTRPQHAMTMV